MTSGRGTDRHDQRTLTGKRCWWCWC